MGHRESSEGEVGGHFSMAEHADEWMEALGQKEDLMRRINESAAKAQWNNMTQTGQFKMAFSAFRKGNPKQPTHRIYQNALDESGVSSIQRKAEAIARFLIVKGSAVGDDVNCPGCNIGFTKNTYQQTFCKEKKKGYSSCKDFINNWFDAKRLAQTLKITGGSK